MPQQQSRASAAVRISLGPPISVLVAGNRALKSGFPFFSFLILFDKFGFSSRSSVLDTAILSQGRFSHLSIGLRHYG
jgi:hypothetical protein